MKRIIAITAGLIGLATCLHGQTAIVEGVKVNGYSMEHNGSYMAVDMELDLSDLSVGGNGAVLITPRLVNGSDTLDMPSVCVYGRRRYYFYLRNNGNSMLSGPEETGFRKSEKPGMVDYSRVLPYENWMNGAELSILRRDWGCCNNLIAEEDGILGRHTEPRAFFPDLVYIRPEGEAVKSRSLEGSAYIDFPVDKTVIYPEYRRNTVELGRIHSTIDSVRSDKDVTITKVWLKGYASPESPYSHNTDLAIGRTAALKKYISQLFMFEDSMIETDYEPEDWAGLRRYVENSNIDHKSEILGMIDADMDPDVKERKIKTAYPQEYRFLLQNCYPALRHTDYRIEYSIRTYSDIEEIIRVMHSRPEKLSLNEFYLLSQQYEPETAEFAEVFETAVRIYPDDEAANLNAANAALRRGDHLAAERYLAKAGNSAEAVYGRAALAIRTEDYDTARVLLAKAVSMGLEQASVTLEDLDNGVR